MKKSFNENQFIDALVRRLGPKGTLIVPTYNWDFCNKGYFNYSTTPSHSGSLGNICLKRIDFDRTFHPIYSFAVNGSLKKEFTSLKNIEAFGKDSPFSYLSMCGAMQVCIGVTPELSFTHTHFVEQMIGVDYRYSKIFSGTYVDERGEISQRDYSMYVRKHEFSVSGRVTNEGCFNFKKIVQKLNIHNIDCYQFKINEAVSFLKKDITHNKSKSICSYKGQ
jgi:aminoglycoside 3-N-acetyltransferase